MNGQALHITAQLRGAACHISGGAAEAGGVVGDGKVIVHGLGDADDVDALFGTLGVELATGVHGAVAAVQQNVADIVLLKNRHHGLILRLF